MNFSSLKCYEFKLLSFHKTIEGTITVMLELLSSKSESGHTGYFLEEMNKVRVKFSVKDNGPGLTMGEKRALLSPYSNTELYHKNNELKNESMNISLCLVQQIVEMHQGTLHLDSNIGHGSELSFVITFEVLFYTQLSYQNFCLLYTSDAADE